LRAQKNPHPLYTIEFSLVQSNLFQILIDHPIYHYILFQPILFIYDQQSNQFSQQTSSTSHGGIVEVVELVVVVVFAGGNVVVLHLY
jgi:hypothetical protein